MLTDATQVQKARKAFADTKTQIARTVELLDRIDNESEAVREDVQAAAKYLGTWIAFLDTFARVVDAPEVSQRDYETLVSLKNQALKLAQSMRSTFLGSVIEETTAD